MRTLLMTGVLVLIACGNKAGDAPPPPSEKGAPVVLVPKSFGVGSGTSGYVEYRAYNFSDKPTTRYVLLMRYLDGSGTMLNINEGTVHAKSNIMKALTDAKYKCPPKSWCVFRIDNIEVPAKTSKIDALAMQVHAEGVEQPIFKMPNFNWDDMAEKDAASPATP